ncbi:hypothetical protein ACHAXR_006622 [Thalassiosira sp. AJA248-18]
MSMLRLCSLDPPKYGWTACGGVASILEPHEMARRQEAKEQFLKWQREEASSAKKASAAANDDAATNNDNAAPKYYTITDPAIESAKAAAPTKSSNDAPADDGATKTTDGDNDNKNDGKKTAEAAAAPTPLKKIAIHSMTTTAATSSNNETTNNDSNSNNESSSSTRLDIYTYHRGRVGQEPRDPKTGELLCDTDPVDTNHGWIPPKTMVKVTIKFPLGDLNEEDCVDSDLDDDDDNNDDGNVGGDEEEEESGLLLPGRLDRSESVTSSISASGGGHVRASRSRLSRGGSISGPTTLAAATGNNAQKQPPHQSQYPSQQSPSKSLPHFIETIQWDLTNPQTPTPEEYAANIATEFGLTFPQTMDLKESIERQLSEFARNQPYFYAPIALLDPYGSERPNSHFGPPEIHCGPVLNSGGSVAGGGGGANKPSVILHRSSSGVSSSSRGGGGGTRPARPPGAIKPDRRGIHVVPQHEVPKAGATGDGYAAEVLKRAKSKSCMESAAAVAKGEEVLDIVHNEVCHICHNRKETGLTFHCGRHTYCDFHCASRLSFRVKDYDKKNPTKIPIDYCPVCTLHCTCAKCTRRLENVAAKMKSECKNQNCTAGEVVMNNLFDLCSSKLKGDRDTKPKEKKEKKAPKNVKIEDAAEGGAVPVDGGGGGKKQKKRRRSNEDEAASFGPRQSINRSTRSSPSMMNDPDARPKKKKKFEPAVPKPVLKVPPSEFPTEMFDGKDLDPSTPDDWNKVFTPDGSFPVDTTNRGSKQKYQDKIAIPSEEYFYPCAVCGNEDGDERILCKKCPRSYHKKCLEASSANDSGGPPKKMECKRCEWDLMVRKEDDIVLGPPMVDKKIQKAYAKYDTSSSYTFNGIVLGHTLLILEKLKEYEYGWLFAAPVDIALVPDYLTVIPNPMDYGTITKKLETGQYSPLPDGPTERGDMDAMEEIVLYALMDIHQVHHNCKMYNSKGSQYYRAGQVMDIKWNAYYAKHIKDRLPESVAASLAKFQEIREAERRETTRTRLFQASNPESGKGKPLAVFDPDTRRIVKQYRSKASARGAAFILYEAGYACEWDLNGTSVKTRIEGAEDPSKPLFGYQWVPTEKLRSGNFKVKPFFREDNLLSPTPNNIVILKEDTVSGVQKVLGFESEESAYQDWLKEKHVSFKSRVGGDSAGKLSDFVANYLDGDKAINGIVYNRQTQPVAAMPKSPMGKVVMEEEHAAASPKKVKSEEN